MTSEALAPYDAVLLLSFGGPEAPDEVMPFLRRVTAGRGIPDERLQDVAHHYELFGGRSPINDQNRALIAALEAELKEREIEVPVLWGNRNSPPFLADTFRDAAARGLHRIVVVTTSAYSSYSSCRQYRENLADAVAGVEDAPQLDKLRHYFNHPGFVEAVVDATLAALAELPEAAREGAHLAFVTHSIPTAMNDSSGPHGGAYAAQHRSVAQEVVDRVREETGRRHAHELVFCSRSGAPHVPWLEPDVNDHLRALHQKGVPGVVMVPVGFVSDHMEVIYDLDTEAMATAEEIGLAARRAATAGVDPRFVSAVRDLLLERAAVERGDDRARAAVGSMDALWDRCPVGCCPNPRGDRPALCGSQP
jgi:ferrochelatase